MSQTVSTFDPLLKEHYDGQMVNNLVYQDNPLLAAFSKKEDFGGRNYPLPVIYGNPQNRSATFSNAKSQSTNSESEAFTLLRVSNYSLATISGELVKASIGDRNAFLEAVTTEIDGAIKSISNDIAFGLGRDSSGYRGQVNAEPSEASTTVITLKSVDDVVGFERNQDIVIWDAKSGGSQLIFATGVSNASISAIDRAAGTITLDEAYDSNGTIAADAFLFVNGDRGGKISGLESWIPDSAPSATAFFGVDRSVDTSRLGGVRTTGTGMPIEEAIIDGAFNLSREGGRPDMCFVNFKQYAKLLKQLGSKVQYIDLSMSAEISFRGVLLHGSHGPIKVLPDRNIRDARAYLLQMDTWVLASAGPIVQLLDADSNRMLRENDSDAYTVRVGSYGQLGCRAPGFNGVVTLDA